MLAGDPSRNHRSNVGAYSQGGSRHDGVQELVRRDRMITGDVRFEMMSQTLYEYDITVSCMDTDHGSQLDQVSNSNSG